jgi:hypothetical protein
VTSQPVIASQPFLGQFDEAHIDAWRACVLPDQMDERIGKATSPRDATLRHLRFFVLSATILGVTREVALARLLERAGLVAIHHQQKQEDKEAGVTNDE